MNEALREHSLTRTTLGPCDHGRRASPSLQRDRSQAEGGLAFSWGQGWEQITPPGLELEPAGAEPGGCSCLLEPPPPGHLASLPTAQVGSPPPASLALSSQLQLGSYVSHLVLPCPSQPEIRRRVTHGEGPHYQSLPPTKMARSTPVGKQGEWLACRLEGGCAWEPWVLVRKDFAG